MLARPFVLLAICLSGLATAAPDSDETRAAIAFLEKLLPKSADPGSLMHLLAVNHAIAGEKEPALRWLQKASALHPDFDPSGDRYLAVFSSDPEFRGLVETVHRTHKPIVRSKVAFRIAEPDLIPEGMAWDAAENTLYVGSISKCKIVKISPRGNVTDFVASEQNGLGRVLGMKVHPESRTLWAVANTDTESGVFQFDLGTGKLVRKLMLPGKPKQHLFNDLVVTRSGDVFLTDTNDHKLYSVSRADAEVREYHTDVALPYPNGIALSPDEKTLFVAHFDGGISMVEIASRKAHVLPRPASVSSAGIDGLYFYRNSLVAVQNGFGAPRVIRYFLSPALDRIERAETLDYRNPLVQLPTTAALAGDTLYFMANTSVDRYENNALKPGPPLGPVLILKRKL